MKKRILSLVLCAALLLSLCLFMGAGVAGDAPDAEGFVPAVNFTNVAPFVEMNAQVQHGPARAPMLSAASANAANTQLVTSDGVVTTKTATANGDGTYTITLTSYTTGNVTQQQTTKPTDFVLVLDQSGSMADDMGTVNYNAYSGSNTQNNRNYEKRHNGGSENLWHKLSDGSYVSVSVSRQEKWTYTQLGNLKNGKPAVGGDKGYSQYADDGNLYEKVDTEYKKVTVTRERNGFEYTYTYTFDDGSKVVSSGYNNAPNLGTHYPLYAGSMDYVYTYTYTDSNGAVQTIGTSTGASTRFTPAFYQRSVSSSGGGSRLSALKTAAKNFADKVAESANGTDGNSGTADDVTHRIAVVGYSGSSSNLTNGFKQMNDTTQAEAVSTAIDGLAADGGTHIDQGLSTANGIFADNPIGANEQRNRVVIVFTDGAPGNYGDWCSESVQTANNAIAYTNTAKKAISAGGYGATVYTIGIFSGADASDPNTLPEYTAYTSGFLGEDSPSEADQVKNSNRFMHLMSSNYPNASSITNPGSVNSSLNGKSYYLSAADAKSLNEIFERISDNISNPTISLGSTAYVQDTVSPYFTAPVNGTVTVSTQLANYDASGNLTWTDEATTTGLTPEVNGKTVKVTGFDYDKNFVSVTGRDENDSTQDGTFHGRRLVVTFTVKAEDAFLGGNNVPTNVAESSGVYQSDGTVVENFDQPEVNVSIKAPALTPKDANVYYGGAVPSAEQLCSTAAYDNAMADFVKISYNTNGTVSNTQDGTYTVTMTVSPTEAAKTTSSGEAAKEQSATVTSTVHVYKPEITYKDSVINLGETADYTNNFVSTVWKHNGTEAVAADMTGTAPELSFAYDPEAAAFTQDTYVKVTVKIGDTDITTDAVTFQHKDGCMFTGGCSFDDMKGQFIVHINVFDLTIEKKAANGSTIDPNQTFVFKVKNNDNGKTMEIVITGAGQKTVKSLPMGNYTITEDTAWSWQYTPTEASQTIVVNETSKTVTFENAKNSNNWLTSLAEVINSWVQNTVTQTKVWPRN